MPTQTTHANGTSAVADLIAAAPAFTPVPSTSAPNAPRVDPFPLEALPVSLRRYVRETAISLAAPPDYVATSLLGFAGAIIGNAAELEIKPGWREGPNLYVAIIGDPGSKKSPAQSAAASAIYRIQRRLKQRYDEAMAVYETEYANWEAAPRAERGPKPRPPAFESVITTDATTEAIAAGLPHTKGLAVFREELTGHVRAMDQYRGGKGADRQHYLSFWSRQTVKVDRKGGPPILVSRPCLSVVGGIQPDLLSELTDSAQREDGFLDRFLFSYPDPLPDRWTDASVSADAITGIERAFDALAGLLGDLDEHGERIPHVIRLSPEARTLWVEWYEERSREMEDPLFSPRLRGVWAKLPSQLARLALILHCFHVPLTDTVSAETLGAAQDLMEYFKSHARRTYALLRGTQRAIPLTALAALKTQGPLSMRDFLHDVFKRNVPSATIRAALEDLEAAGLVRRDERKPDTGRPALTWLLA